MTSLAFFFGTLPLALLGQKPPPVYQLAPGDVLGIWVEGVLSERGTPMPVYSALPVQVGEQRRLPPAAGYPRTGR